MSKSADEEVLANAETKRKIEYNEQANTSVGTFSVNGDANLDAATKETTFNANVGYSNEVQTNVCDVRMGTSVNANQEGDVSYDVNVGASKDFDGGITTDINVHNNASDTSVSFGVRKNLINADNINDSQNQDRLRKEELVETGERFNLQTKVGYSNSEKSLYTENSLMFRVDDKNFLNASYNQRENGREISATADLEKVKLNYANNESSQSEVTTITNTFDVMTKGKKNQYNVNFNAVDTVPTGENGESSQTLSFTAEARFNRTEYGEFQDGFNGAVDGGLYLQNGQISGYKINLDGAYNYYGSDHGKTTDYLVRGKLNFENQNDVNSLRAGVGGAYRINNCRTIFESGVNYTGEFADGSRNQSLSTSMYCYQQVGKEFGQASIFGGVETTKKWVNFQGDKSSKLFTQLRVGADIKAGERVSFNGSASYDTDNKWTGNIGVRYTF